MCSNLNRRLELLQTLNSELAEYEIISIEYLMSWKSILVSVHNFLGRVKQIGLQKYSINNDIIIKYHKYAIIKYY